MSGACDEYVQRFRERFGDSVEVTEALCAEQAQDWNWHWAGHSFLDDLWDGMTCKWCREVRAAQAGLNIQSRSVIEWQQTLNDRLSVVFARLYIAQGSQK